MSVYKDLNDYEIMYLVEERDENAEELLFDKYKPIVLNIASYYKREARECNLDIEDLIQEGYLGLYNAIRTFDPSNDVLFYTYATISIRGKILNFITTRKAVKHRVLNQGLSLYKTLDTNDNTTLIDVLEDKSAMLPHLIVEENELENITHEFLLSLDIEYAYVFELKMNGFKNGDIVSLLDIPSKNVDNMLFKIRKKFKQYLKNNS